MMFREDNLMYIVKRGGSAAQKAGLAIRKPGVSKFGHFHYLSLLSCINEYLAMDGGGHVSE